MSNVLATINGHYVEIPVDLFNDLALIPKSDYRESYWINNHMETPCFDMETDNGWNWTIHRSNVRAQVLQISPNETRWVDAAIPASLYKRFIALIPKAVS